MQKKTKYLIAAGLLVAVGVGLSIVLGKGKELEDVGKLPPPDENGNTPPADGTSTQTPETQEPGGTDAIAVGDLVTPYNEYVNVRTSMEINNGWFHNNLWISGVINDGKIFSPNIVGKVLAVNNVGGKVWYQVDMGPSTDGDNETAYDVELYYAQDDNWQLGTLKGYVRGDTCASVNSEDQCVGDLIPTLKKV